MQGRLRKENLVVTIRSECAHCRQPLEMEVDQDLNFKVTSQDAAPLIFEPDMNWAAFGGANIINDY